MNKVDITFRAILFSERWELPERARVELAELLTATESLDGKPMEFKSIAALRATEPPPVSV